ncbi:MAG: hypothetical protein RL150_522 [Candidatus Parcubacteria bacterium]|jgi:type IV pilus assembly protein PilB
MYIEQEKLKSFMVDSGLVTKQDIDAADEQLSQNPTQTIGDYLISQGKITDDDLKRIQAYILGIPFIDLSSQKIPLETLSIIPEPIARNHNVVPYKLEGDRLEVAMLDTDDLSAVDFIKKKTGYTILPRLTSTGSIKSALIQYQKSLKADFGDLIKKDVDSLKANAGAGGDLSEKNLKAIAEDIPVVRVVDTLLKHAILQNASDIHMEPQEDSLVIRYRVDGLLHDAMTLPKESALSITARIKVLASLKLDEKRLPQDGRFKIMLDGEKVSFRVSILPTYYGEKTVMRVLREGGGGYTLEGLGFHGVNLERIYEAMKQTTGLILTTGPTGSGKSTTLYTLLELLNTPDVNISTVEDPIEYQMKRINQTQVKPDIGFTFAEGLRSLVRQDPDIIMVGEIRDGETAGLAINAALTGHLVLSTLHTNSAAGAVPRLMDMGAEPFLLVSTLRVIIAQRLVRKLGKQREKYTLSAAGLKSLGTNVNLDKVLKALQDDGIIKKTATWADVPFYRPKTTANDDGYAGRVGIHEVLKVTPTIQEMIVSGKPAEKIEEQALAEGMLTMLEDGVYKAVQGLTTIEEVLRVISE